MGRMGVLPADAPQLVERVTQSRSVRLAGIYSHFATADFQLTEIADHQQSTFQSLVESLRPQLPPDCIVHLANSAATITRPDAHYDMVRPGLALYGYAPADYMREQIDLRPILRLVSHLSAIKTLPPNHCVGYGQTFTTMRDTRLGIVPVGYFDGFQRKLSNNVVVGTPHGPTPVIGRISMDQLAVDLTDLPPLALGDEITLIDADPNAENSVESLARRLDTIPYEVTCCLGPRIDRIVMQTATAADETALTVRKSVGV
jgi:alanine racemase